MTASRMVVCSALLLGSACASNSTPAPGGGGAAPGGGGAAPGGGGATNGNDASGPQVGGTGGDAGGLPLVDAGGSDGDSGSSIGKVSVPGMICDLASDTNSIWLGEMRIFTNRWTDTDAHSCVFLNKDGTFGWNWQRGNTGPSTAWGSNPNYPEIEFGINPWNEMGTDQSTTTLLPLQIKDINSASVTVDVDAGSPAGAYDLAFEMWFAVANPALGTPPLGKMNVKGELMVFFAEDDNYYPQTPGTKMNGGTGVDVQDGANLYKLFYSDNAWADWGYYRQYRLVPKQTHFNGKLDIMKFLAEYVTNEGGNANYWVTRVEIGNEYYRNSTGNTVFKSVTFEVNGQTRSAQTH